MTSAGAEQAMRRLNGTLLDGRSIGGELAAEHSSGERREEKKPQRAPARDHPRHSSNIASDTT